MMDEESEKELISKIAATALSLHTSDHPSPVAEWQAFVFEKFTDAEVIEYGHLHCLEVTRAGHAFLMRIKKSRKHMQDVMIDIETMALHPSNALILSIGLVEFDPTGDTLKLGERIVIRPDIEAQLLLGRCVETGTQEFWADQLKQAQDDWRVGRKSTLQETVDQIAAFTQPAKRIWANGIVFDIGNVASLIRQTGNTEPWHYRAPRDMRTFCEELPQRRTAELADVESLVRHVAISDCLVQCNRVWQHWPEPEQLAHYPV